ncbi:MAG: hypothetical protein R3D60_11745 [Paracoccaceae bacterium]
MRIAIIGLGYVAISDALALGRAHEVTVAGPLSDRVRAVNEGRYPLRDPELADYVARWPLSVRATTDVVQALDGAEMILVSTPLPHCPETRRFHTEELDTRIALAHALRPQVPIVIRSAVPIGYTARMRARLPEALLFYAPEFLREGHGLRDMLAPAQIVVGDRGIMGERIAALLASAALNDTAPRRLIGPGEAEAVKHFSQAYLAARVAYFNELDSYAMSHDLNARQVIDGVCLDPRIGGGSNNPCFGFGGQRLPRSTSHLTEAFGALNARVLPRLAEANEARLALLTAKVMERGALRVGVYRPTESAARDALHELGERLAREGTTIVPFVGTGTADALAQFKSECDLVLTHRMTSALTDIAGKVFCRDLYMN